VVAEWKAAYNGPNGQICRVMIAALFFLTLPLTVPSFYTYSHRLAQAMSHTSLVFKATANNGEPIIVDDYRKAYWWLRDNTPEDARVMAWWDYGYQIAGIANRTSIADGNTWNHEHIATLARCLVSNENEGHKIIRHLADYILVWTGGGGDDLAKSIHLARIGNSVYKDICPNDPICSKFGMTQSGPTAQMAASLLYKLHSNGQPGVTVNSTLYQHVYTSPYGKVKIYKVKGVSKKSKAWAADPANRECDAPGSWYCPGKYPPAIDFVLKEKKAFKQLEDFNVEGDNDAEEYHKQYMKTIQGH
jgi:dolichyl-diphosphooligosaccharide--protein glycosyltransferase